MTRCCIILKYAGKQHIPRLGEQGLKPRKVMIMKILETLTTSSGTKIKISFEIKIISAHRTPKRLFNFALSAERNNISVIIAGAGGSAHLPGMVAAISPIPVIGVPIESKKLKGLDSLLSIVQMPKGIPVGSVAIGKDGAINAALYAATILAISDKKIKSRLKQLRSKQTKSVKKKPK